MTAKDETGVAGSELVEDPASTWLHEQRITIARLGLLVGVVGTWQYASYTLGQKLSGIFIPIEVIVANAYTLVASGSLTEHIIITTQEVAAAFVLAAVLGIVVGTILGANEFLAAAIEPIIYYISTVPKIVYYPLLIMLFGVGPGSKIAKGVMSAFFPIVVLVTAGALNVNTVHVQVSKLYRASAFETLRKVYLPSMIVYLINGLRLGIGAAIISVTLAEIFVSKAGLGNQLNFYFSHFQLGKMYGIILLIFVVAFAINMGLLGLQQWLATRGYGGGEAEDGGGFGF